MVCFYVACFELEFTTIATISLETLEFIPKYLLVKLNIVVLVLLIRTHIWLARKRKYIEENTINYFFFIRQEKNWHCFFLPVLFLDNFFLLQISCVSFSDKRKERKTFN